MKIKILFQLIFFSIALGSCKKDIKEPSNFGSGKTKIYFKVDDTEYLFEDKNFNIYKNTRSDIYISEVQIDPSTFGIYIEFKFKNYFKNRKIESYYYTYGYINIDPEGIWLSEKEYVPNYFLIRGDFYDGSKMPIDCRISHEKNQSSTISASSDSLFLVNYYNFVKKKFAIEYNGLFEDRNDKKIPRLKHTIKLIIQYEK
jgi:hypothetical protein